MTQVLTRSDLDRMHAMQAEAEDLRCRNVIEKAGWSVEHSTTRNGRTHFSIVKDGRHWYGSPQELAERVQNDNRKHKEKSK
jgi:hypothetical protein